MRTILRDKIAKPLMAYLKQGTSPHQLALGVALGGALGLVPFLGITTWICIWISISFRINMGVLQLANYAMYPLQLILYIPFLKLAIYVFGLDAKLYAIDNLLSRFEHNFWDTFQDVWVANMLGVLMWATMAPLVFAILYLVTKRLAEAHQVSVEK